MTTRSAFRFYSYPGEMRLYQDLINESIQIIGFDALYLPARLNNYDHLYNTSDLVTYDTTYTIEVYLETYQGFTGDQSFMSKFGLEIRNQCYFTISNERFMQEIGIAEGFTRPREKDLIYFPMENKCFQIFFVDNKWPAFYALGILPAFKCTCELFEYSNERMVTGVPGIDRLMSDSTNIYDWAYTDVNSVPYTDEDGNVLLIDFYALTNSDPTADNKELTHETDTFVNFNELNPWGDIER